MDVILGPSACLYWPEKADVTPPPRTKQLKCSLRCYRNIVLLEGRGDHVKGVNLGRALDKPCQRLQNLRLGIGVVRIGIVLVIPQTDGGHIAPARTSECDFVFKTILSTKQRKD